MQFESLIQVMPQDKIMQLLHELVKNSKRSDRDLAKILGVSQPTLTRMRKRLERDNYILDYTAIPNLTKLGFEIIAFTFLNVDRFDPKNGELDVALGERAHKWVSHNTRIVFSGGGEGLEGKNCMMVSLHMDFTEYTDFIRDFRGQVSPSVKDMDTFLVSLKAKTPKQFSLRDLEIIP
jgi:DNA-binding Lrp family transcriptional regulator